ncbi:unnamed protein product [Taenia asiatica]|uniref:Uncharacterized protein n=1 Tax=Taenia asiatica TaxID=60517 RepID=A0A0R3WGR9_TAEAS|nr:unnamed protein product [Taenia asiatica]
MRLMRLQRMLDVIVRRRSSAEEALVYAIAESADECEWEEGGGGMLCEYEKRRWKANSYPKKRQGERKEGMEEREYSRTEKEVKNGETRAAVKDGDGDDRAVLSTLKDSCADV